MEIRPIAHFHSPFASKFGIPKQSGLAEKLKGSIVFLPEYRNPDFLRGIEGFDFIWLIWGFSANKHTSKSPVVRPPLLGGNEKVGVFASRSPFRPNAIGLSSVRISSIDYGGREAPTINVMGADLMDGTPIYDIKPYLVYADSHPLARSGFVDRHPAKQLEVVFPSGIESYFSQDEIEGLREVLALDPRPHYHDNPDKIYGVLFFAYDIHFRVSEGLLTVVSIDK